jgi:hypothetical protein
MRTLTLAGKDARRRARRSLTYREAVGVVVVCRANAGVHTLRKTQRRSRRNRINVAAALAVTSRATSTAVCG